MKVQILSVSLLLASTILQATAADVLPAGAKPLSTTEIEDLYPGNTFNWERGRVFFAPNKSAVGYYDKQYSEEIADGMWSVDGNEFCYNLKWTSRQSSENQVLCRRLYRRGIDIIMQETKNSEGSLSTYPLLPSLISKGDKTHDRYMEIKQIISN